MTDNKIEDLITSYNQAFKESGLDFAVGSKDPIHKFLVLEKIRQEYFTLKDTMVSARVLNHWKSKNILPLARAGGWNKFSLLELVWIDIVKELRKFGFSLKKISIVRDQLFQPIDIEKKREQVDIDRFYEDVFKKYKSIYSFNILGGYIVYMLTQRKQVLLTVLSDGGCSINDSGTFTLYDTSFITIRLFPLIKYFILDHANRTKMMDLGMITEEEQLILDCIKQGEVQSLTVYFDDQKEIRLIETQSKVNLKEIENKVGGIIAKGTYQKITLMVEDGKTIAAIKNEKIYHK